MWLWEREAKVPSRREVAGGQTRPKARWAERVGVLCAAPAASNPVREPSRGRVAWVPRYLPSLHDRVRHRVALR